MQQKSGDTAITPAEPTACRQEPKHLETILCLWIQSATALPNHSLYRPDRADKSNALATSRTLFENRTVIDVII